MIQARNRLPELKQKRDSLNETTNSDINRLPELKQKRDSLNETTNSDIITEEPESELEAEPEPESEPELELKTRNKLYSGPIGNLLKKYLIINICLQDLENHLINMKSMVAAININSFNQKEFDKKRNESLKIGNDIVKRFKKLESKLPEVDDFTTLARMKRSLYYGFFQQYIVLWSKNEEFLLDFEQKLKQKLQMQSQILNCNLSDEDIENLIENKSTNLFVSNIIQDTETERKTLQELQDRFDELKKLEKSITDVRNLFISLQNLVAQQGDTIQLIETHYNAACEYVDEGKKTIKIVRQMKQSRSCMRRCCCFC